MRIADALPERKVRVIVYSPDNGKYIPIFRGSSKEYDKIYNVEYDHVAPSQDTYRFYLNE